MYLISSYPARVISAIVAIILVMVGAMINISACEIITPNDNVRTSYCHYNYVVY